MARKIHGRSFTTAITGLSAVVSDIYRSSQFHFAAPFAVSDGLKTGQRTVKAISLGSVRTIVQTLHPLPIRAAET